MRSVRAAPEGARLPPAAAGPILTGGSTEVAVRVPLVAIGICLGGWLAAGALGADQPRSVTTNRLTPEQRQALDHLRSGQKLMRAERFDAAADEFRNAVRLDPLLAMAYYGLGQAQMALKNYPEAVRAYLSCREAFGKLELADAGERAAFGQAREDQIRDLKDSIRQLEMEMRGLQANSSSATRLGSRIQTLQLQVDSLERLRGAELEGAGAGIPAEVLLALGSAHFRSSRPDDAEREYKAAIAARPKFGEAHTNLAVLYLHTGRAAEALQELKLAEKSGFRVHPELKKEIEKAAKGK
jgi:tetratricopeptide (TPR) repeat protein